MMYAGTLSYFAQDQAQHELAALASKAKNHLLAAKGIFGYEPKITYLFGLPRTISSGGIHLDIETTHVLRSLDNDQQKTIDFAIQTGPIGSALEHALKEVPLGCQVPEQLFNTDPNNPTQAVSTVKALQLANAQGQQIYKIDNTNIDTVLPKLKLSQTIKNDIQSSVNAGKYVITHTDNISVPGWNGAGYAIIDPQTGDNAYMISGGENGGFILTAISVILDVIKLIKVFEKLSGKLVLFLTFLTNIVSNLEALYRCLFTGTFSAVKAVALALTVLQTVMYIYMMTFLIASPLGLVYGSMASTIMEIMQGDMQGGFLDGAC